MVLTGYWRTSAMLDDECDEEFLFLSDGTGVVTDRFASGHLSVWDIKWQFIDGVLTVWNMNGIGGTPHINNAVTLIENYFDKDDPEWSDGGIVDVLDLKEYCKLYRHVSRSRSDSELRLIIEEFKCYSH